MTIISRTKAFENNKNVANFGTDNLVITKIREGVSLTISKIWTIF